LAEEPRFPDANRLFQEHLRQQGQALGQQALERAMERSISGSGPAGAATASGGADSPA
jgi:hypothetical protein